MAGTDQMRKSFSTKFCVTDSEVGQDFGAVVLTTKTPRHEELDLSACSRRAESMPPCRSPELEFRLTEIFLFSGEALFGRKLLAGLS
jgi:hypothetical protein